MSNPSYFEGADGVEPALPPDDQSRFDVDQRPFWGFPAPAHIGYAEPRLSDVEMQAPEHIAELRRLADQEQQETADHEWWQRARHWAAVGVVTVAAAIATCFVAAPAIQDTFQGEPETQAGDVQGAVYQTVGGIASTLWEHGIVPDPEQLFEDYARRTLEDMSLHSGQ